MGRRIGLLGGTFDPPHFGHLWLAETAYQQLQLDQVLFLPVGAPVHKNNHGVTDIIHRKNMVQLALANAPHFSLDTRDIERPQPHAMFSLLPLLRHSFSDVDLWLLLGADSLRDLGSWLRPQEVVAQCRLAVLGRPDVTIDWPALDKAVPGIRQAVDLLGGPSLSISSTEIRNWTRQKHSVRYLVPFAVDNYMRQHQLYSQ